MLFIGNKASPYVNVIVIHGYASYGREQVNVDKDQLKNCGSAMLEVIYMFIKIRYWVNHMVESKRDISSYLIEACHLSIHPEL